MENREQAQHSTGTWRRVIARDDRNPGPGPGSRPACIGDPSLPPTNRRTFSIGSHVILTAVQVCPLPATKMYVSSTSARAINPDAQIPGLSATSASRAITKFKMPAMSPTMTEGGIASWKKREGDSFTAGDVLLEIVCRERHHELGHNVDLSSVVQETDKAVIDVEAQDDGVMGKILVRISSLSTTMYWPASDLLICT